MLLIRCPWCGPRAEIEFRHGGEAHIARPPQPSKLDDQAWAEHLFFRANPQRPACRAMDRTSMGASAGSTRSGTRTPTPLSRHIGSASSRRSHHGNDTPHKLAGTRVITAFRLPAGGRIDRSRPLSIRFNGRHITGCSGDTVASILLANGIHHVARSFKYHRPRGVVSHGSDEPSALLTINLGRGRIDPNNRASVVEACDGLEVSSQNHWPSLNFDLAEVNDLVAPLFAAGFYYRTFKWPKEFWGRLYEPAIRRLAGLGTAPDTPDPDRYTNRYAHCEVQWWAPDRPALPPHWQPHRIGPSGSFWLTKVSSSAVRCCMTSTSDIDGMPGQQWLGKTLDTLSARDNVVLLRRTTAFGYYNHNFVGLCERVSDSTLDRQGCVARERLWQVRAARVVLATGAHEQPLTFANNDRPGIMLADSVRAFINRWAVAPGRDIVVATNGASAYQTALDARAAGLSVTIVDTRNERDCGREACRGS